MIPRFEIPSIKNIDKNKDNGSLIKIFSIPYFINLIYFDKLFFSVIE